MPVGTQSGDNATDDRTVLMHTLRRQLDVLWAVILGSGVSGLGIAGLIVIVQFLAGPALELTLLPSPTAATLPQTPAGQRVLVEGHISARNPVLVRSFVAYARQEYRGEVSGLVRGRPTTSQRWDRDGQATPPLLVEMADGFIRIGNGDYTFQSGGGPVFWQEPELYWDASRGQGTRRYTGFEAGNPVLVLGSVTHDGAGPAIQAEWIAATTRTDFLREQWQLPLAAAGLDFWVLVFGIATLGQALRGWRRLRSTAPPPARPAPQ